MATEQFVAFLGAAVLLTVMPGADMALVTRQGLAYGRVPAMTTVYGILAGLVVWAALAVAGLGALLAASATAFTTLKLIGGAYLVWLGLQTIWGARGQDEDHPAPRLKWERSRPTGGQAFRQGMLSNLLNPKVGLFYATFLPQFVAAGDAVVLHLAFLAGLHILMGAIWLTWYIRMVARAGEVLRRPAVRRLLERVTGAVLVALGLRLATTSR